MAIIEIDSQTATARSTGERAVLTGKPGAALMDDARALSSQVERSVITLDVARRTLSESAGMSPMALRRAARRAVGVADRGAVRLLEQAATLIEAGRY